jgi:hypothetical protein
MELVEAKVGMRVRLTEAFRQKAEVAPQSATGTIMRIAPTEMTGDPEHDYDVFWGMAFPIEVALDGIDYSTSYDPTNAEQWYDTFAPEELEVI